MLQAIKVGDHFYTILKGKKVVARVALSSPRYGEDGVAITPSGLNGTVSTVRAGKAARTFTITLSHGKKLVAVETSPLPTSNGVRHADAYTC